MQMDTSYMKPPIGQLSLHIQIGHKKLEHTFLVCEKLPFPLFVGKDLIRKSDMIIHEKADSFWFPDMSDVKYSLKYMRGKHVFLLQPSKISSKVDYSNQKEVDELLNKFSMVAPKDNRVGRTSLVKHKIELTSDKPVHCNPCFFPPNYTKQIKEQIDKLLEQGFIKEVSESKYNANIVLAPKPNNKVRMTVGYKKLNKITKDNLYPMHKASYILKRLPTGGYYSKIDCNSGFWQIAMEDDSVEYTTFNFQGRLYQFLVMPFGLKNSPATFVGLMNEVLKGVIGKFAYVYVDDIIVFSKTKKEHFMHLEQIFERLKKAGLTISLEKSQFCMREISFLGHVVTQEGIKMQPEKVRAIVDLPAPVKKEELHTFVGMCAWYQSFIPNFSSIAAPLYKILSKNALFSWGPEQEKAFDRLKMELISDRILATINYKYPIVIRCDASNLGCGAICIQYVDGVEKVIHYASKLLNKHERLLHACEKELLAILWAVEKFHEYIYGEDFYIVTDNKALKYLDKFKDNNTKLGRWALRLAPYVDKIRHISGKENTVADALSRNPVAARDEPDYLDDDPDVMFTPALAMVEAVPSLKQIKEDQEKDEDVKKILQQLTCQSGPTTNSEYKLKNGVVFKVVKKSLRRRTRKKKSSDAVDDDEGVATPQVVVHHNAASSTDATNDVTGGDWDTGGGVLEVPVIPKSLQGKLLRVFHDNPEAGHFGVKKTRLKMSTRMYWNGMSNDIREYVRSCDICQRVKFSNQKPAGLMGNAKLASKIFSTVYIDFLGPFVPSRSSRNQYLLVIQDELSKWVEFYTMKNATAEKVVNSLKDCFFKFGFPDKLISDNGKQFTSNLLKEFCKSYSIDHRFLSTYHAQQNQSERVNRTLIPMIRAFVEDRHNEWDKYISEFAFAIRTAVHDATGVPPALLNLGRELQCPFDRVISDGNNTNFDINVVKNVPNEMKEVIEYVRNNLVNNRQKNKKYYDEKHRDVKYDVGQEVLVRAHILSNAEEGRMKKLARSWLGPFKISQPVNKFVFMISDMYGKVLGKKHVSDIKLYVKRNNFNEEEKVSNNNNNFNTECPRRSTRIKRVPLRYSN